MADDRSVERVAYEGYIGKCEILFCKNPASETIYIEAYGEEKVVCQDCYLDRTTERNSLAGTKREQLSEAAEEFWEGGDE